MLNLKLADIVDDEQLVVSTRDYVQNILQHDPSLLSPHNALLKQYIQQNNSTSWDKIS